MERPQITAEAVAVLVRATGTTELRREAARNKAWAKLLRGFRPQAVKLEQLVARAGDIVGSPALLRDLALVFLRSAGMPESGPLRERLRAAAARDDLPDAVRAACALLVGTEAPAPEVPPPPAAAFHVPAPVPEAPAAAKPRRARAAAKPKPAG